MVQHAVQVGINAEHTWVEGSGKTLFSCLFMAYILQATCYANQKQHATGRLHVHARLAVRTSAQKLRYKMRWVFCFSGVIPGPKVTKAVENTVYKSFASDRCIDQN